VKRWVTVAVLLLAITVALAACGDRAPASDADDTPPATDANVPSGTTIEGSDPMPTDGPNETAALGAVAGIYAEQRDSGTWADVDWAALDAVAPVFNAYLVRVDLGGQAALFEVRSDGLPHNLYAFQKAFDSGSIIWIPAEDATGAFADAQSSGELMAVGAVNVAMRDAFPDDAFTVTIHGYRFVYLQDGRSVFTIEVAPDGSMISAGGY
jgi:hypothetical protein